MKVIGLCGGSGSGKGSVSLIFNSFGIPSVDTDRVYRELTSSHSECLFALVKEFGESIIKPDGSLDRASLRNIVFEGEESERKRERLNEISHKYILDKTDELLSGYKKLGVPMAIVDAPLLFESGYDKKCDVILAVLAEESVRINRIMKRDGLSYSDAKKRVASQIPDEKLKELCDFFIVNNGDFSELEAQTRRIADQILNYERGK